MVIQRGALPSKPFRPTHTFSLNTHFLSVSFATPSFILQSLIAVAYSHAGASTSYLPSCSGRGCRRGETHVRASLVLKTSL